MPNGYRNQPISGFTGYIPGAKWQVGSRYVAGSRENSGFSNRNASVPEGSQYQTPNATNQNFSAENRSMAMGAGDEQMRNFTEMTNDELRERLMKMQMDMQNLQMAMSMQNQQQQHSGANGGDGSSRNAVNFGDPSGRMDRRTEYENGQRGGGGQQEQLKQRSKSMPRKIENNPFDGIESGWWSKGEVKRNQVGTTERKATETNAYLTLRFFILFIFFSNKKAQARYFKERREIANGGQMVSGGNWNQWPPSRQRVSRRIGALEKDETEDIPTAGYSGHIQGLRQLGVGKPFNVAAKQAKKEYIERRRTYSGSRDALNARGRGTQFSEEVLSANPVKLPDNRF
ncbi:Protein CBG14747 [Caenorhabditis briggsae]|uniref:Protein CBG14747 n=1 Tax=Caenorhabditis briggsae TaxID=6238 RepID=A8XKK8_CAEBR|nr:Protein CBG14747 [Caenorhabditis briggsae]CAP33182.2 Protein CBG14747 [Caenorhabditis briggsae]